MTKNCENQFQISDILCKLKTINITYIMLYLSRGIKLICLVLLLSAFAYYLYLLNMPEDQDIDLIGEQSKEIQTLVSDEDIFHTSLLTGEYLDQDSYLRQPVAVIIENHPHARPQAGLAEADIVLEAVAEEGITRFVAIFQSTLPSLVGPIRSARSYFLPFIQEHNAKFAHVGGNRDALEILKNGVDNILDIDEMRYGDLFWRDYSTTKITEHTMYSSAEKLSNKFSENEWDPIKSLDFKKDIKPSKNLYNKVTLNYSSHSYQVDYHFDEDQGKYIRHMAGQPHIDKNINKPISIDNILVLFIDTKLNPSLPTKGALSMKVVGEGNVYLFTKKSIYKGVWIKNSESSRLKLLSDEGEVIYLSPGKTWIHYMSVDDFDRLSFMTTNN
jgi:hypothetical protein